MTLSPQKTFTTGAFLGFEIYQQLIKYQSWDPFSQDAPEPLTAWVPALGPLHNPVSFRVFVDSILCILATFTGDIRFQPNGPGAVENRVFLGGVGKGFQTGRVGSGLEVGGCLRCWNLSTFFSFFCSDV